MKGVFRILIWYAFFGYNLLRQGTRLLIYVKHSEQPDGFKSGRCLAWVALSGFFIDQGGNIRFIFRKQHGPQLMRGLLMSNNQ